MNRSYLLKKSFNQVDVKELLRKTAVHEAGHATAIYLGNKQQKLPPVFFQIFIKRLGNQLHSPVSLNKLIGDQFARIEGGRLIHTLPSSFEEEVKDFSEEQKQVYQRAFEADIINLLVGPLAEANYIALRDNELMNPRIVNLNALYNYGGFFDLEIVNEYLACFIADKTQREKKVSELFLAAFNFINDRSNWFAITSLANYILADNKDIIDCEEVMAVVDTSVAFTRKRLRNY
ncbi:MAG: hypothetical protein ACXW0Q_12650 [Methylovulum sp.]